MACRQCLIDLDHGHCPSELSSSHDFKTYEDLLLMPKQLVNLEFGKLALQKNEGYGYIYNLLGILPSKKWKELNRVLTSEISYVEKYRKKINIRLDQEIAEIQLQKKSILETFATRNPVCAQIKEEKLDYLENIKSENQNIYRVDLEAVMKKVDSLRKSLDIYSKLDQRVENELTSKIRLNMRSNYPTGFEERIFKGFIGFNIQNVGNIENIVADKINEDNKRELENKLQILMTELATKTEEVEELEKLYGKGCIREYSGEDQASLRETILPETTFQLIMDQTRHGNNIVNFYKTHTNTEFLALKIIDFHNREMDKTIQKNNLSREFENMQKCRRSVHITKCFQLCFNARYALFLMEDGGMAVHDIWPKTSLNFVDALKQLSQGLAHIHSKGIYHGDIKPQNILYNYHNNIFKFTDFGASIAFKNSQELLKTCYDFGTKLKEFTQIYFPPEILWPYLKYIKGANTNTINFDKVDVFSLGFTIYSIIIRNFPYAEGELKAKGDKIIYSQFLHSVGNQMNRILIMENKQHYINLILKCLSYDPHDRPSPLQILQQL